MAKENRAHQTPAREKAYHNPTPTHCSISRTAITPPHRISAYPGLLPPPEPTRTPLVPSHTYTSKMAWFSHLLTLTKPTPKTKTAASAAPAPAPGWLLSDCSSDTDEEVSVLDMADLDALEAELAAEINDLRSEIAEYQRPEQPIRSILTEDGVWWPAQLGTTPLMAMRSRSSRRRSIRRYLAGGDASGTSGDEADDETSA